MATWHHIPFLFGTFPLQIVIQQIAGIHCLFFNDALKFHPLPGDCNALQCTKIISKQCVYHLPFINQ
jgi:hypothetical protein